MKLIFDALEYKCKLPQNEYDLKPVTISAIVKQYQNSNYYKTSIAKETTPKKAEKPIKAFISPVVD